MFDVPLEKLKSLSGKPEGRCRSMIGKWLKQTNNDNQAVYDAIMRAAEIITPDPFAYVTKCLDDKPRFTNHLPFTPDSVEEILKRNEQDGC